jgi:hypothetical protein
VKYSGELSGHRSGARLMKMVKLSKLFKLFRLLRIGRLVKKVQQRYNIRFRTVMILSFGVTLCFLAHWVGCIYYIYASNSPDRHAGSWIYSLDEGTEEGVFMEKSTTGKYITLFYWSIQTMTTIGYGDINPGTTGERVYVTIAMMVGAAQFAYGLSNVVSAIRAMNEKSTFYNEHTDLLTEWSAGKKITNHDEFGEQLSFLSYRELESSVDSFKEIRGNAISSLSPVLRQEVLNALADRLFPDDLVVRAPRLPSMFDHLFKHEIVAAMKPTIFSPHQTIIDGKDGHFQTPQYLYLAHGGALCGYKGVSGHDIWKEGSTLGEFCSFLGEDYPHVPFQNLHVVSETYCDVYMLEDSVLVKLFSIWGIKNWERYSYALRQVGARHKNRWIITGNDAHEIVSCMEKQDGENAVEHHDALQMAFSEGLRRPAEIFYQKRHHFLMKEVQYLQSKLLEKQKELKEAACDTTYREGFSTNLAKRPIGSS